MITVLICFFLTHCASCFAHRLPTGRRVLARWRRPEAPPIYAIDLVFPCFLHLIPTVRPAPCPMQADLFGEVAEAKEAVEFAGAYKEAKKCRAYETYQLLAGLITFGERAAELLTTVQVGVLRIFRGCECGVWAGFTRTSLEPDAEQADCESSSGSSHCLASSGGLLASPRPAEPAGRGEPAQDAHKVGAAAAARCARRAGQPHRCAWFAVQGHTVLSTCSSLGVLKLCVPAACRPVVTFKPTCR